jgi:hypothetical protein
VIENLPLEQLEAAIARIEAEKQSRLERKIEAGEVLRVELAVVGERIEDATASVEDAKARKTAELRAEGEAREIYFDVLIIATGVPRHTDWRQMHAAKDTSSLCAPSATTREPVASEDNGPAPSSSSQPAYICTIVVPATDEGDPGEIAEGWFSVSNSQVVVTDGDGQHIASRALMKGRDPASLARELLREARKPQTFTRRLDYPKLGTA